MPLTRRPPVYRRGKAERRARIKGRHWHLHTQYVVAVEHLGCELTYRQWLHSPQRKAQQASVGRAVRPHRSGDNLIGEVARATHP